MGKRLPDWFKQRVPKVGELTAVSSMLTELKLNTVCESALCPNLCRCFAKKTATFMIMGNVCTRNCTFCAVNKGKPLSLEMDEPERIAMAVTKLGLEYVVITSVTRDDLGDGGASHFARTIEAVHSSEPDTLIEVLIPDFQGSRQALESVVKANPSVINHNMETVPVLYPEVRPMAGYERSLELLARVKKIQPGAVTKSGLMLGLGEKREDVMRVMMDLRQAGCDLLTLGQYLAPTTSHHPVVTYVTPQEFTSYIQPALDMGFAGIASAPLVRSSYRAAELYQQAIKQNSNM